MSVRRPTSVNDINITSATSVSLIETEGYGNEANDP